MSPLGVRIPSMLVIVVPRFHFIPAPYSPGARAR
jgi:hypothetical protein